MTESQRSPEGDNFRLVVEELATGEAIGDLTIHSCDRRAGCFSYGINIRADRREQGFAREAIRLALRYYFEELGYQKVTVSAYDFNVASIRLHERLGFVREGRLRRVAFTQGHHVDEIVFGLTVEEYRSMPSDGR